MDRLEYLKLRRKDIIETINNETDQDENYRLRLLLQDINKQIADERIRRLN